MVTKSEMRGIQGWFLKRLGCFSINQLSPSLTALRYAIDLVEKGEQLVVFPEGKINKYGEGFKCDLHGWEFNNLGECTNSPKQCLIEYSVIEKEENLFANSNR